MAAAEAADRHHRPRADSVLETQNTGESGLPAAHYQQPAGSEGCERWKAPVALAHHDRSARRSMIDEGSPGLRLNWSSRTPKCCVSARMREIRGSAVPASH